MRRIVTLIAAAVMAAALAGGVSAAEVKAGKAGPKDKCPVCGMFVAKYPDFAAQVRFRDGTTVHFDGAKDLFKYWLNLSRYAPGRKQSDIAAVFVTGYYDLAPVDGFAAFYVIGSDVNGPMGPELVPFAKESQARDFLRDHGGKAILRFRDVTPKTLAELR